MSDNIRRIDDLGRVVIPKAIRRELHIHEGDPLQIIVTDEGMLLKKLEPSWEALKCIPDKSTHYALVEPSK